MLKNYLIIAIRQIWKNKLFSALNIFGLATSLAICLLIILILLDQFGYDQFHENKDRIYRVISSRSAKNEAIQKATFATTALSLGARLKENYPFIENTVRTVSIGSTFKIENKNIETDSRGYAVDQSFLETFSFGWVTGDKRTALLNPKSIVLNEKTAKILFPYSDPMGKTIELSELGSFTVTGIIPEPPVHSHIRFNFLISFSTVTSLTDEERKKISIYGYDDTWRGMVYVLLNKRSDLAAFKNALSEEAAAYSAKDKDNRYFFDAQSIKKIMPSKNLSNEIGTATPIVILYFFMALGVIIILSACFNYTNLTIARSLKRAKEIGIRKVSGAQKRDIVFQFLGESIMVSLFALILAIGLLEYLIPAFLALDPFVDEVFEFTRTPAVYFIFFCFSLLVGLLAGFFPAFSISAFHPIESIKQLAHLKLFSHLTMRKILIVFQFALSLVFILAVIIVLRQQQFVLQSDIGVKIDQILNVRLEGVDYDVFAQQAKQIKGVAEISGSEHVILTGENRTVMAYFENQRDSMKLFITKVTANYPENHGMTIVAGSSFAGEGQLIINEVALERMGFLSPNEAVDQTLVINENPHKIVGVVKNFHHNNIWFEPIEPYALSLAVDSLPSANILLNEGHTSETLAALRSLCDKLSPDSYLFTFFTTERVYYLTKFFRIGSKIIGVVGFLTILIACMGLLGMVIYAIEGKIKEVGIRKVLGASVGHIVWHLSKQFLWLLVIATVLALPLALFGANLWLQNFILRMKVGPLILLAGTGVLFSLGFVTILSQTYLAARTSPSKTLKSE